MTAIAINRFHARYRLAPGTDGQRERLQRILAQVIDNGLEAAVPRRGIDTVGELCIREVNALAWLDLSESESALAAKLALAIADAIESGMGKQGLDLVHYGSRAHALIDLTVAAVGGDFTRSWAWRRLGVWNAESAVTTASAVRLVLRALTAEPRHAAAALAHLARNPLLFNRLLRHASPPQLLALARAVVGANACSADVLHPADEGFGMPIPLAAARRLAQRSAIAGATAASVRIASVEDSQRHALAVLAVCEVEPALLRAPGDCVRAFVHAVLEALDELAGLSPAAARDRSGPRAAFRDFRSESVVSSGPGRSASHVAPGMESAARQESRRPAEARPSSRSSNALAQSGVREPRPPEAAPGEHPLPEVRRRAHTRFGGLLYLIHLVNRLGLAERILLEPRLAERSPRWCLHQLATALVPVPASDPAALAFAGLLPRKS